MKRKPNKPRPEAQTHTEPGNGAAEPGGSAFGAGSEQEPGAAGTSGQSVPKSKFRQKSQQEQAAASKLRMEKRGEKREAAREKAAAEASEIFSRCPVCGRLVCDRCFLICEDLDLCIACAKTLQVRGNVVAEEAAFPQELPAEPAETIATEGDGST